MPLWTDIVTPVEATAIARDEQYVIEQRKGSLARWLPNIFVPSDHVKFVANANILVDVARYRAFNAPPEIGKGAMPTSKSIDLPAISRNEPIDELTQKELGRLPDDQVAKSIAAAIRRNVQAISMRQELTRGSVIETGKVVVDTDNFWINDDFGRNPALSITAAELWSTASVDRLSALNGWLDIYRTYNNGANPGAIICSTRAFTAFAAGTQFATLLANGATRPALKAEVNAYADAAGLPPFEVYDRSVPVDGVNTKVLSDDRLFFAPEPVDPMGPDPSVLGATYWGLTVSAGFPSWNIEPAEQPGIVCGVYREERVGASVEVQGDALGEPVAQNANSTMAIKVL